VKSLDRTKTQKKRSQKILILGLGNTLLCDDGIGVYIAREIKKRIKRTDIAIDEASIGGLELLDRLNGYDKAILIDSIVTKQHPVGTVIRMKPKDLPSGSAMTRHHVGLPEALALGEKMGMHLPKEIVIYGIEASDTQTFQESCTPKLSGCIPEITREILECEGLL
jgi:hydrogenase maturation protease